MSLLVCLLVWTIITEIYKKQPKNNQKTTKKQPKNNQKTTKKQPKNKILHKEEMQGSVIFYP